MTQPPTVLTVDMSVASLSNDASRPACGDEADLVPRRPARKISCAECHRLKLKCDRDEQIPCGSCIRRGCESICPQGTLRSSGRGKRSVMSEVPELTSVITEMGERIRQLERALQVVSTHVGESSTNHPLLSKAPQLPMPSAPAQHGEVLGSFSVSETGNTLYFGPTAGSEALFTVESASDSQSSDREPISFKTVTESFSFSSCRPPDWDMDQALGQLFTHLPLEVRALSLCETYYRNGCWTGMPLAQDETLELLMEIYGPFRIGEGEEKHRSRVILQQMAVLYFILALGSLVDLELPPYSLEADHYFDLGCAAMSVRSLFEGPTLVTVQALALMALYYAHGGRRYTVEGAWSAISLASSISQTVRALIQNCKALADLVTDSWAYIAKPLDCHRKLPTDVGHALFWETYHLETVYGLSVSRPTGTFLSDISCPFPANEDERAQPFVNLFPTYRKARWEHTKQVTARIMEALLTTAKLSYETVLDLDQKIRRYMLSSPFESFPLPQNGDYNPSAFIQRYFIPRFTQVALMYIHKGSFIEALRDNPTDPLSSPYSASFLAGYRSASEIIKADIMNFTNYPMLFTRWWAIWKGLFNAAIIVGTVAIRCRSSKMAPHAMVELFTAADLIERGAASSVRARNCLATLHRLIDKAVEVHSQYSGHNLTPPPTTDSETEGELEIFAGYTRVVANKVLAHGLRREPTPYHERSDPSHPPTQWQNKPEELRRDFDPSITEYFALPNSTTLGNVGSLAHSQEMASGQPESFPLPPSYTADVFMGLDFQQPQSEPYEIQWEQLLQSSL